MAFRGQHEHNLDSKDRITVPAAYRAALADGVVVVEGVEECVEVYPQAAAEQMEATYLAPLNQMSRDARRMKRRFFGSSESTELDSAGRVRLPGHLIQHAALDGRCLVVGAGDHLEIWSPAAWDAESEEVESQVIELTERAAAQIGPAGSGKE